MVRTDRVLAELDLAEAEVAAEHQDRGGTIVIGAFPSTAARPRGPRGRALAKRYPRLSLQNEMRTSGAVAGGRSHRTSRESTDPADRRYCIR